MVDLDHAADHLADLVEQEGLALEVEADKLDRTLITGIRHSKGVLVDVHVLIRSHVHHVALGGFFVRLDLLCVVVIFLSAFKVRPEAMHKLFLLFCHPCGVHCCSHFG